MPMSQSEMLHQMCQETLSKADVKAICQVRGFSAAEAESPALFESFFLSDIGVSKALLSLKREEIALLHLLNSRTEPVNIVFFARIYADSGGQYGTFTQRYQETFQAVRTALVRRGVLLMGESGEERDGETKMERWRFRFPQQFAHLLPPMLETPFTSDAPGEVNHSRPREKVMSVLDGKRFGSHIADAPKYQLAIHRGQLQMGDMHFTVQTLQAWQQACWEAATAKPVPNVLIFVSGKLPEMSPVAAVRYVFSQLAANAWMTPDQLTPLLKVFCDDPTPQAAKLCEAGWEWGCLARHTVEGATYYHLAPAPASSVAGKYKRVLDTKTDQIKVDLANIFYSDLEILVQVTTCKIEKGGLIASPSLVRLGNLPPALRTHPLLQWLEANSPTYAQTLQMATKRWGKQIVHENLLVAKINDLSLKVVIQKALSAEVQLQMLPNNFIAFPPVLLPTIEKLIKQAGHVIKHVKAEAKPGK